MFNTPYFFSTICNYAGLFLIHIYSSEVIEHCPECKTSENLPLEYHTGLDIAFSSLQVSIAPSQWISGVSINTSRHL